MFDARFAVILWCTKSSEKSHDHISRVMGPAYHHCLAANVAVADGQRDHQYKDDRVGLDHPDRLDAKHHQWNQNNSHQRLVAWEKRGTNQAGHTRGERSVFTVSRPPLSPSLIGRTGMAMLRAEKSRIHRGAVLPTRSITLNIVSSAIANQSFDLRV